MSHTKQSLVTFRDSSSTGIDKIADGRIIYINSLMKFFIKDNNTSLISSTNIDTAIINKNIVEMGTRQCYPFSKAMFFGGDLYRNKLSSLTKLGALSQTETSIGTGRFKPIGVNSATVNCLFYSGVKSFGDGNLASLFSSLGVLVQAETSLGDGWKCFGAGSIAGSNGLFYGGSMDDGYNNDLNLTTLITPQLTLAQPETNVGTARTMLSGCKASEISLFYGGYKDDTGGVYSNKLTILNNSAALVSTELTVGTARWQGAGATSQLNGFFFSGSNTNTITLINASGTLIQPETNVGTVRSTSSGCNVGVNCLFYKGSTSGLSINKVSIFTPAAVLFQAETTIGLADTAAGSASL